MLLLAPGQHPLVNTSAIGLRQVVSIYPMVPIGLLQTGAL